MQVVDIVLAVVHLRGDLIPSKERGEEGMEGKVFPYVPVGCSALLVLLPFCTQE
jgi:hypothetical protein